MIHLKDIGSTRKALAEIKRLSEVAGFNRQLEQALNGDLVVENTKVFSDELFRILEVAGAEVHLNVEDRTIDAAFVQLLVVHKLTNVVQPPIESLSKLKHYVKGVSEYELLFAGWQATASFIIYQDYFNKVNWTDYLERSSGEWGEINLLDVSLPYCKATLPSLFSYIELASAKNRNDAGVGYLSRNILKKLLEDQTLAREVAEYIPDILSKGSLSSFLPTFLVGYVNGSREKFRELTNSLLSNYGHELVKILYALGTCCPSDAQSLKLYKKRIDEYRGQGAISSCDYVRCLAIKNYKSDDVLEFLQELSSTKPGKDETLSLLDFLLNNIEDDHSLEWFETVARNVVIVPGKAVVALMTHFFYRLSGINGNLSYSLITSRFEELGSDSFLETFWSELVSQDFDGFQAALTNWFKTGNRNVHSVMLKLCSVDELDSSCFQLSETELKKCTASEKLYIAYKVAGYIYSKEHLQSLIFSLVRSVDERETRLLQHLFSVFADYVIYNYRSTLEQIEQILKEKKLPQHLLDFYASLQKCFEDYFHNLETVEGFKELRMDQKLSQHVQYFTQQHFSKSFKEAEKKGISSFFKNTPVHSHRWAIKREGELVHQVSPLSHIETSIEFPAGEKLNPVGQETLRRTYRKFYPDEINID